ncbi:MAG: hypothetical protein LBS75_06455 [Synergistaceae bacterium]|jgi:Tfp pilus assembly protein PilV|nr:hypothetical protein [Synergistaceae bacterium]
MSAQKTRKTRGKAFAGRRPGFSLAEVIIALFILTAAIFASFETIGYALLVTTEVRGRMTNYSRLEHIGLLSAAKKSVEASDDILMVSDDISVPITIGGRELSADITKLVYKHAPGAVSGKMKSPVFVVFLLPESE